MKILHTSDWHVGRRIRGRDRSSEQRRVLAEIRDIAARGPVDLTIVAGDVFDSAAPGPLSEQIAWRGLLDLAEIAPVVVIGGNHDSSARLDAVEPLLAMAGVTVVGSPRAPGEGGVLRVGEAAIATLPFVSQRGVVKVSQIMGADPDQHAVAYEDRMRRVIEALCSAMPEDAINVLTGHLTVYGAEAGGGERKAHVFGYAIPSAAFPSHLSYVALGHLHRQQRVPHAGAAWYSGSPLALDFGEVGDEKGVLLVDATPGLPSSVTSVPLSSGRRLLTLRGTLEEVAARAPEPGDAHVKVVLTEKARVGLADAARAVVPDAVEVVLDDPEPSRPSPEPRRSLEPTEAFARYLSESGVDDPDLEGLFAELLGEVTR